jgi:GTP cyclohydrolase I
MKKHTIQETVPSILDLVDQLGGQVGEEVRENTPRRVAKAWSEMLRGYKIDPIEALGPKFQDTNYDELVLVRNIEFTSVCEHHLFPFYGVAHVGYIPGIQREIVGLSKLARLVESLSCRLQVQERLTVQVASTLDKFLSPLGVAVVVRARHGCMHCRGVHQRTSDTVTSVMLGKFRTHEAARAEVFQMIGSV